MRDSVHGLRDGAGDAVHGDGALDEAAVRRLARRQIDAGIHFLVPCGTTGEAPTLTPARAPPRRRARGRGSRAAGCRCWPAPAATTRTRSSSRRARCSGAGADGLLSVTPYYNKPTQEGLYQHYQRDRRGDVRCPIIVYNVPGRTGCNVGRRRPLARLAAIPNIVGVKEASGNMTQICEMLRAVPAGLPRALGRRCAHAAG